MSGDAAIDQASRSAKAFLIPAAPIVILLTSLAALMERIRLSPEDYSEPEMRRLTSALIKEGIRVFVFSFHSPSIQPGGTPYVQSQAELRFFLDKCRHYFDYFFNTLGGSAMTPVKIKRFLNGKNSATDQ